MNPQVLWEDILADAELTTGDEMDLTKAYQPLAYYMTDHEELLNQLFATVKGTLLASVMPTVLKVGIAPFSRCERVILKFLHFKIG